MTKMMAQLYSLIDQVRFIHDQVNLAINFPIIDRQTFFKRKKKKNFFFFFNAKQAIASFDKQM